MPPLLSGYKEISDMDDFLKTIVINAPNLIGLVVLAYVLFRQVERLTDALLLRIDTLEREVSELKIIVMQRVPKSSILGFPPDES